MSKKQFFKVNNSLLELEKFFIEFNDIELKDREVSIIVSINDMDRFEKKKK